MKVNKQQRSLLPMLSLATMQVGNASLLIHRRSTIATVMVTSLCVLIWTASLALGEYALTLSQVVAVLLGGGLDIERTVVIDWRLARSVVALAVGAALGMSGSITQIIARNGLASPDILGIGRGASTVAVALMVASGGATSTIMSTIGLPVAAMAGGLVTACAIWLLSRHSGSDMFRLLLIGIGVNAALQAVITYMLATTDLNTAAAAKVWMIGTINGRDFEHLWPTLCLLIIAFLVLLRLSIYIPAISLGADAAQGLGVPLKQVNITLLIVSVILSSVTVSAVGPVGFVAFVAPQIAARIARVGAPPILLSAAMGAALLSSADLAARIAFPWEVPVGIVTAAIGGPFLIWLLLQTSRAKAK